MTDIRVLLHAAAAEPRAELDMTTMLARARRRPWLRISIWMSTFVALVGAGIAGNTVFQPAGGESGSVEQPDVTVDGTATATTGVSPPPLAMGGSSEFRLAPADRRGPYAPSAPAVPTGPSAHSTARVPRIAFWRYSDGSGFDGHVIVMDGDGTDQQPVAAAARCRPSWSPDSSELAFCARAGIRDWRIRALDLRSGKQRELGPGFDPAFSPDGRRIAFSALDVGGVAQIFTMSADGSDRRQLTSGADNSFVPAWHPDSRQLAFIRADGAVGEGSYTASSVQYIWLVNADGSNLRSAGIATTFATVMPISFAPDGDRLAFECDRQGSEPGWGICVKHLNGSEIKVTGRSSTAPSWSADGDWIVFNRWSNESPDALLAGAREIWIMRPDGTEQRRLTSDAPGRTADVLPAIEPTGERMSSRN